jgi:putative FmdB family regulatory protein
MPTYEYRCSQGHHFELFQRISEAAVDRCPQCDAPAERIISGAGLIFKGSGFYITDYRSDTYKKAAEADQGASAPATSSADSGGSSATESKSKESKSTEPKPAPKPASDSGSTGSAD